MKHGTQMTNLCHLRAISYLLPCQITERNRAKLPNEIAPNYRFLGKSRIFASAKRLKRWKVTGIE